MAHYFLSLPIRTMENARNDVIRLPAINLTSSGVFPSVKFDINKRS